MTSWHPRWRTRSVRRTVAALFLLGQGLPAPVAMAQTIAPNAAPQGGRVVAGSAGITQNPATTVINQSTNRAVINWRSFDVGQDHTVQFQQPSAQAMTLNRVTTPNPSVIAGHITANGGIALVNQSGVVFAHGSQVQAQSVIVSTADISNQNFMSGGPMAFNRAGKPDARIVNDGDITVKQAGLAALVAPQVANHGVIEARLGTVVLGGAETHVIDLNGDGLVSFDVTGAVRKAPNNGEALVTNTGVIRANGGTVQLTAAAADGVVQDLVRAGGRIQANTDAATGKTGRILLEGTGGSISVAGDVSAQGLAAGTKGGTIGVLADAVQVEKTARINASGRAGGGTIAIGTSLPGAATQRLAQGTGIAKGAVIKADATDRGNGGHVVVNSVQETTVAGDISARGGPNGGDGGLVEVSGQGNFSLIGVIDAGAPAGHQGLIVVDPDTLEVVADTDPRINLNSGNLASGTLAFSDGPTSSFIGTSTIGSFSGALTLQASTSITVSVGVDKTAGDLTLESPTLTLNAPVTLENGDLSLIGGTININSTLTVTAAHQVILTPLSIPGAVVPLVVAEGTNGVINAGTLTQGGDGGFATISLTGANKIATIDILNATNLTVVDTQDLVVSNLVRGDTTLSLQVDGGNLTVDGEVLSEGSANPTSQLFASGNITIGPNGFVSADNLQIEAGYNFTTGAPDLGAAGGILIQGAIFGARNAEGATLDTPVFLAAGRGGITENGGTIQAATLTLQSGGDVTLTTITPPGPDGTGGPAASNEINVLGASSVQGNFTLATYTIPDPNSVLTPSLQIAGNVDVTGTFNVQAVGAGLEEVTGGRILANTLVANADDTISLLGDNQIGVLGQISGFGVFIHNSVDLQVDGPIDSGGGLTVASEGNLVVNGSLTTTDSDMLLQAGGNLTLSSTGSLVANLGEGSTASITLEAAAPGGTFDPTLSGSMTLAGSISAVTGVTLHAGTGGIHQTGGSIQGQTLAVRSGGDALLFRGGATGGTPNSITSGIAAQVAGDFEFDNGDTDITIPGAISAGAIGLRTTGTLNLTETCARVAPFCTPASLNAGAGRISLEAGALAFDTGVTVTGGLVEIAPATNVPLVAGDPAGTIMTGSFMVNQDVLSDITATTLRLGADTFGGTTTVTRASLVNLSGPVTQIGTLDLRSLGDITQGAAFQVGTLTGAAGGNIVLTNGGNTATTIGDLSAGGTLSLTLGSDMSLAGTVSGTTVTLDSSGNISETGAGIVIADQLALAATGSIALGGANQVAQLLDSSAGTTLLLNDVAPTLNVAAGNVVQAGEAVTLIDTGDLTIAGTIRQAPSRTPSIFSVTLTSGGDITEPGGGIIQADQLTLTALDGSVDLPGANQVGQLLSSTIGGNLFFNDVMPTGLTVPDGQTVRADEGMTLVNTGDVTIGGILSGPTVTLTSGTNVQETGTGFIVADQLALTAEVGLIALGGANQVSELLSSTAGTTLVFNDVMATGLTVPTENTVQAGQAMTLTNTG
ncbi:MAG TPA: filamentous hemagglutinin N-terminal domain-containing protein, partial [Rhodopila sp.]|uniref:beta strand repeat-containing protein n=1 Tax=Rhodopila sp. TaxID=2480087 RepID=UPI002B720142